jgi:predicted transcriptional regulator
MKVRDAMSPEVQLCTPDDTLKDAAEAMAALGVGLLPVTDNELVGMISDRDIAIRGVALGRGPDSRVGDVMTAEVKYCYDDQDLDEVTANMGEIQVRRLPVLKSAWSVLSGSATSRRHKRSMALVKHAGRYPGRADSTRSYKPATDSFAPDQRAKPRAIDR